MGFLDFITFKSVPKIPGVNDKMLKHIEGFQVEWLDDPLFKDFLSCCGQLTKTDMDVARVGSNGYMKKLTYGKITIRDKRIQGLFEAIEVDETKLDEDGYICGIIHKLMRATKEAKKKQSEEVAEGSQQAVYVCALVLARYILAIHPEYNERIQLIAKDLKDLAK